MNLDADIILSETQKRHLKSLVYHGHKVKAIKELRDMVSLSLMDARDYILDIYDAIEKERTVKAKKDKKGEKINITTYGELKEYLIDENIVEKDNDSLWDIVDLAFDAGMEEGETRGYKIRLEEEAEEKYN